MLSATSNETTAHTAGAVHTSNEAFGSVDIAATAADELSKSIAEINRQLVSATEVVRAAAIEAQSTNDDIAGLAQAAQKIDDVVKLIQSVAGQTNLLALNATIEAAARERPARALPSSLPKSKRLRCRRPRRPTSSPARSRRCNPRRKAPSAPSASITGRMQEIRQFTAAIATSVEQQHAATSEISNNVAAAAAGTKSVVAVLQRVSAAIADMRNSAETVLAASQPSRKPPTACAAASTAFSARSRCSGH